MKKNLKISKKIKTKSIIKRGKPKANNSKKQEKDKKYSDHKG